MKNTLIHKLLLTGLAITFTLVSWSSAQSQTNIQKVPVPAKPEKKDILKDDKKADNKPIPPKDALKKEDKNPASTQVEKQKSAATEPKTGEIKDIKKSEKKAVTDPKATTNSKETKEAKETKEEKERREKREEYIKKLLEIFSFGTTKERLDALEAATRLKVKEDILKLAPGIKKTFDDKTNKLLLRKAIEVSGELKLRDFLPQIIAGVSDTNSEVRRTAIAVISKLKAKEGGQAVFDFFQKQDLSVNDNVTLSAIETLANLEYRNFAVYSLNTLVREYPKIPAKEKVKEIGKGDPVSKDDKNPAVKKEPTTQTPPAKGDNKSAVEPNKDLKSAANTFGRDSAEKQESIKDDTLYWNKEDGKKLDMTVAGHLILKLGDMKDQDAGPMFHSLLEASFRNDLIEEDREDGKKIDDSLLQGAFEINVGLQEYLVNALGKIGYKSSQTLLRQRVSRIEGYISKDRKNKYLNLYLQCLAALVRLGDSSVTEILVRSLRDDSPGIRLRSAMLFAELRNGDGIEMLGYRAINDENRSVRFESLKALMEIAEPGSTKDGKIIGQEPTAEGRDHAVQEIVKFMDFNKNPDVVEEWLQYLGKNIYQEKIEMALVKFLQKRMERFLPRNRQKKTVQAASAMVRKKLQKMKISKGPALDFLLKTQESKNHRDAAQEAKRALAEIKRLEEDLAAGKVKEKAQDKQLEPVKDKAPLKIKK